MVTTSRVQLHGVKNKLIIFKRWASPCITWHTSTKPVQSASLGQPSRCVERDDVCSDLAIYGNGWNTNRWGMLKHSVHTCAKAHPGPHPNIIYIYIIYDYENTTQKMSWLQRAIAARVRFMFHRGNRGNRGTWDDPRVSPSPTKSSPACGVHRPSEVAPRQGRFRFRQGVKSRKRFRRR